MAEQGYGKSVFRPDHIADYTTAIHSKCEQKEDAPIKGVQLLTLYEITDVMDGYSDYGEEISIFTNEKKLIRIDWNDITKMCADVDGIYSCNSIKYALDIDKENYDILFAVKDGEIIGFLVTLKGECDYGIYKNIHTVHLVCAVKGIGSLLIGAYLYCVSFIRDHDYGLLTLMNSVKNASGFFSYSKMGFSPEPDLIKVGCFAQRDCLPMITQIDKNTRIEVVERFTAKRYEEGIGMSTDPHFIKNYGAGLSTEQYIKIATPLWEEYDKKCKSLIARYSIMKSLGISMEGHYKELIEKLKELEAMKAFHALSLKSDSPEHIVVNEIDELIKQVDQLIFITKDLKPTEMPVVERLIKQIETKAAELYQPRSRRKQSRSRSPVQRKYSVFNTTKKSTRKSRRKSTKKSKRTKKSKGIKTKKTKGSN